LISTAASHTKATVALCQLLINAVYPAQRRNGATAQRRNGATAQRRNGATAAMRQHFFDR
jgi:hypothetical protein